MKAEEKNTSSKAAFKQLVSCSSMRWATPPMRPNSHPSPALCPRPPELCMGQSHIKSTKALTPAPARGKDAATLNPHLGPALKTHPSWSLGRLPAPEARGPQAEHGEAGTFCPIRAVLPNLFTPPEFQHLRRKSVRAAYALPA